MASPRRIDLIGIPLDLGSGRRGVDMGPSALRIAQFGGRVDTRGVGGRPQRGRRVDRGDRRSRSPPSTTAGLAVGGRARRHEYTVDQYQRERAWHAARRPVGTGTG